MLNVELVVVEGCHVCKEVKKTFDNLKPAYDFTLKEFTTDTDRGHYLTDKYDITSAPGIVINDEYFTSGHVTREEIIQRFEEIKNR